jgi:D-tyrosyl-tRNA(Tyr) deacylase
MRAVVQRVRSASVTVAGDTISEMQNGLVAMVGVGGGDGAAQAREMARRLVHLRIFADVRGRMNLSLLDTGGTLCVVSNFTLYGDARHGRRPCFGDAAAADRAAPLIETVVQAAQQLGAPVVTGRFQATMEVSLINDGPVTLLLDTDRVF